MIRNRSTAALAVASLLLAACSAHGSSALPSLAQSQKNIAAPGGGNGIANPVADPTSLNFTALGAANAKTFAVTVQFAGDLTAVSSDTSVATVSPSTASPTVTPTGGGKKSATFTVTPAGNGTCTITITDKKGGTATVTVTVSSLSTLYAVNAPGGPTRTVMLFPADGSGNIAPQILGSTGYDSFVDSPGGVTTHNGMVYIACLGSSVMCKAPIGGDIEVFPIGASGNIAPTATIGSSAMVNGDNTQLTSLDIRFDGAGDLYTSAFYGGSLSIVKFPAGQTGNDVSVTPGPWMQYNELGGWFVSGFDVAPNGDIWGASTVTPTVQGGGGPGELVEFPAGSTGAPTLKAVIAGTNSQIGYPLTVRLDSQGNIYALTSDSKNTLPRANPRIVEYAAGSNGNIAPIRTIEGPSTGLVDPGQMLVDPSGGIYVSDSGSERISYFAPGASGNVAPVRVISGSNTGFAGLMTIGI